MGISAVCVLVKYKKGCTGQRTSFPSPTLYKQRGMGESFMIKTKGFFVCDSSHIFIITTVPVFHNSLFTHSQNVTLLIHKAVTYTVLTNLQLRAGLPNGSNWRRCAASDCLPGVIILFGRRSNAGNAANYLLLLTLVTAVLNLFGLMRLIPLFITLPALFISIYLTIYSFTNRNVFRGNMRG